MTVTAIGEIQLGVAIPGVQAALAVSLADLEAKIAALIQFKPIPVNLQLSINLCLDQLKGLQLALSLGLPVPSLDAQIAIILAQLAALRASLQILLDLKNTFEVSAHLYRYDGAVNAFGTEMQAELSGGLPGGSGSDTAFALTFIATAPASIAALQAIFKTSP